MSAGYTFTVTCPDWCQAPHDARELADAEGAFCHAWVAPLDFAEVHVLATDNPDGSHERPAVSVYVPHHLEDSLTAEQARELATALLAAADVCGGALAARG